MKDRKDLNNYGFFFFFLIQHVERMSLYDLISCYDKVKCSRIGSVEIILKNIVLLF